MVQDLVCKMVVRALVFIWLMPAAFAGLGDSVDSIRTDSENLSGNVSALDADPTHLYNVYEIETDSYKVRQYVSVKTGKVFGVAWNGLVHPDLKPLLGVHHRRFSDAVDGQSREFGKRHFHIRVPRGEGRQDHELVVQKWGHPRMLQGRAYFPAKLPTGVDPDDIK